MNTAADHRSEQKRSYIDTKLQRTREVTLIKSCTNNTKLHKEKEVFESTQFC